MARLVNTDGRGGLNVSLVIGRSPQNKSILRSCAFIDCQTSSHAAGAVLLLAAAKEKRFTKTPGTLDSDEFFHDVSRPQSLSE